MFHFVPILLSFLLQSPAHAEFLSFAYNSKTGNWGASFDETTVELASDKALKNCGSGCRMITATDFLSYAYLALDPKDHRIWGWSAGTWREDAYLRALQACNGHSANGTCRIVTEYDPTGAPAQVHGAPPWLNFWYCDTLTRDDASNEDARGQPEYTKIWALTKPVAQQKSLSNCKNYEEKACVARHACKPGFMNQR
jgi:hypothetical protein